MSIPRIFTKLDQPRNLRVADPSKLDWNSRVTLASLQGIINRKEPRIYLAVADCDRHWLNYYCDRFGVSYVEVSDPMELVVEFAHEVDGYILYDEDSPDTANVAITASGIRDGIPASRDMARKLSELGLKKVDDVAGKNYKNRSALYRWAFREFWPECNHKVIGSVCVCKRKHWGMNTGIIDYLTASRSFVFHLSTAYRDREEYKLFDEILEASDAPGVIMGWHCVRDQEKEHVARAAKKGFFVLCSPGTPNLTVHGGIKVGANAYSQRKLGYDDVEVEEKVYIAFYCTDGDAIWAMSNLHSYNWLRSERGSVPFNWGILPLLTEVAPGMIEFYYDTETSNDYFMCPSSGAAYTYSFLHDRNYLDYSRNCMKLSGQITANMVNWDTNLWWREVEDDRAMEREKKLLGDCIGFVCGLGGSAFAKSYLGGRAPKVHAALVVHDSQDIEKQVRAFVECTQKRPLFLFAFAQISGGILEATAKAAKALAVDENYEILLMDEFMLKLKKALDRGLIKGDLYPEKDRLRELQLVTPGRANWKASLELMRKLVKLCSLPEQEIVAKLNEGAWDELAAKEPSGVLLDWDRYAEMNQGWSESDIENVADAFGYDLFYIVWAMVRSALNVSGNYANHKDRCLEDFLRIFGDVEDVDAMKEIWWMWDNWEGSELRLDEVKSLTVRALKVAERIDSRMG